MKNLLNTFLVAIFGMFSFSTFGLPIVAGAFSAIGFGLLAPSAGAELRSGLDLSAVNTQLGAYYRQYEKKIWARVTNEIHIEKFMRHVPNITDEYAVKTSRMTEVLQPFQKGWTPKGQVEVDARINRVRQIKGDIEIDNLDELFQSHLAYMADETKDRDKWPFIPWLVNENVIPKVIEEMATIAVFGEYAAPAVPGTPGASIDSTDGILTVIAAEIAATNITPITTGVINDANIIDVVDDFVADITTGANARWKRHIKRILVSEELVTMYKLAREDQHGVNMDYKGMPTDGRVPIRGTNIWLEGIPEMAGSQRMIATYDNNLLCLYDKIQRPNNMQSQLHYREVALLLDYKRGYGFGTYDGLFVNDQA